MARVFVGLGSNLEDRLANLRAALARLREAPGLRVGSVSSVWESEPVGPVRDQPSFLNAVIELSTEVEPRELLRRTRLLEAELGRQPARAPKGPRLIDLDLLLYGDRVEVWPELALPHPEMSRRAFVLRPLLELDPEVRDPRSGRRFADQLEGVSDQRLQRIEEPLEVGQRG